MFLSAVDKTSNILYFVKVIITVIAYQRSSKRNKPIVKQKTFETSGCETSRKWTENEMNQVD